MAHDQFGIQGADDADQPRQAFAEKGRGKMRERRSRCFLIAGR